MNRRYSTLVFAVASLLAAVPQLEAADAELVQLHSLDELRAAFNQDTGIPRVVLLLSPT